MALYRQSLTEAKSKTEGLAPTLFDKDREVKHLAMAGALRNMTSTFRNVVSRDAAAQKQQIEDWLNDGGIGDVITENDKSIF